MRGVEFVVQIGDQEVSLAAESSAEKRQSPPEQIDQLDNQLAQERLVGVEEIVLEAPSSSVVRGNTN